MWLPVQRGRCCVIVAPSGRLRRASSLLSFVVERWLWGRLFPLATLPGTLGTGVPVLIRRMPRSAVALEPVLPPWLCLQPVSSSSGTDMVVAKIGAKRSSWDKLFQPAPGKGRPAPPVLMAQLRQAVRRKLPNNAMIAAWWRSADQALQHRPATQPAQRLTRPQPLWVPIMVRRARPPRKRGGHQKSGRRHRWRCPARVRPPACPAADAEIDLATVGAKAPDLSRGNLAWNSRRPAVSLTEQPISVDLPSPTEPLARSAERLGRRRSAEFESHPTPNPIATIVNAIRDLHRHTDPFLDCFGRSFSAYALQ